MKIPALFFLTARISCFFTFINLCQPVQKLVVYWSHGALILGKGCTGVALDLH